jgi:hypothetical protein
MALLTHKPKIHPNFRSANVVITEGHPATTPSGKHVHGWGRVVLRVNEHSEGRITATLSRLSDDGWDCVTLDASETAKVRQALNRAYRERQRPA